MTTSAMPAADAPWSGVPLHPDRDGGHFLSDKNGHRVAMWWLVAAYGWCGNDGEKRACDMPPEEAARYSQSCEPIALPSEVAALRAVNAEMLAALRALLEIHIAHHNNPAHVAARAAIARAEQEQSA